MNTHDPAVHSKKEKVHGFGRRDVHKELERKEANEYFNKIKGRKSVGSESSTAEPVVEKKISFGRARSDVHDRRNSKEYYKKARERMSHNHQSDLFAAKGIDTGADQRNADSYYAVKRGHGRSDHDLFGNKGL